MKFSRGLALTIMLVMLAFPSIIGQGADLTGQEIVRRTVDPGTVKDMRADLEMRIINKSGQERFRQIALVSKKGTDGGEQMLMRFLLPADVKGTGFLSITHPGAEDESWLYLPALGKPRRIASEERGGSFMGSDFTYADIGLFQADDYRNTLIRSEKLDGDDVYVVESIPGSDKVKRECGFAKKTWWIRKSNLTVVKAEFVDGAGRRRKVLQASAPVMLAAEVWFNGAMEMKDLETGSHTIVGFKNIKVNTGVADDFFSLRQLTKAVGG